MERYSLRIIVWGISLCSALFIGGVVQAFSIENLGNTPQAGDFVVGPGKTEVSLDAGQEVWKQLTITNRYGHPMKFNLEIEDFKGSRVPGENIILMGNTKGPYSLKDFIKPEVETFSLEHGQRITVPIKIAIPLDSQPGGLYGSVIVTTQPDFDNENVLDGQKGNIRVISRLASLFFVRVNGDVEENGSLIEFSSDKKFYQEGPIIMKLAFENNGSIYLNPYGSIEVTNFMGANIDRTDIQPFFVMPDAIRQVEFKMDRKLMIGRYKATVYLKRGYDRAMDVKSVVFWVLPWKVLVAALLVIILLVLSLIKIKKWFKKNFEIKRKKE